MSNKSKPQATEKKPNKIVSFIKFLVGALATIGVFSILFSKYIEPRLPSNNLQFSSVHIANQYEVLVDNQLYGGCDDSVTLYFTIENIDSHEAVIENVNITLLDYKSLEECGPLCLQGLGDDTEYIYYIADISAGGTNKAYMFSLDAFSAAKSSAELFNIATEYSKQHFAKVEAGEIDQVYLQLINFPDEGFYSFELSIEYTIGRKKKETTLSDNIEILSLSSDTIWEHMVSLGEFYDLVPN